LLFRLLEFVGAFGCAGARPASVQGNVPSDPVSDVVLKFSLEATGCVHSLAPVCCWGPYSSRSLSRAGGRDLECGTVPGCCLCWSLGKGGRAGDAFRNCSRDYCPHVGSFCGSRRARSHRSCSMVACALHQRACAFRLVIVPNQAWFLAAIHVPRLWVQEP
jgi:hypothetical protein